MALHIHRSERADRLADALAAVLASPLDDPMATEIVAVPTRGVERWVSQQLSATLGAGGGRRDGVCANVAFPFPARLVEVALTAGDGAGDRTQIWRPERLVWPLMEVVEACLDEDWMASLASYLRGGSSRARPGDRRFGAVRHVAELFDRYGVHRPAMVRAWARGEELDDRGAPLPPDGAWQARLWLRLRAQVGTPSPAELLEDACGRLRDDPSRVDLPFRLSVFGVTRVPASHAEVLRALAVGRAVHLFALHPSPALWDELRDRPMPANTPMAANTPMPANGLMPTRRDDASAAAAHNPLLSSWGRDAREMQLVLTGGRPESVTDRHYPVGSCARTLLERLQDDVRANREPPGVPFLATPRGTAVDSSPTAPGGRDGRAVLDPGDRSLTVHRCHGSGRQVEVLRDAILHLLADDPTLEPRDVIVMCPDIETFAPLVHATFGAGADPDDTAPSRHGDPDAGSQPAGRPVDLPVRLADRSLRQTNPVLGVVSELLDLADARLTASQVLDLASRGPVRARFGFDDDDLARLEQWVGTAGIRWGLDAAQRGAYGLGNLEANTWRSGLDRLLLGAAMTEDDLPLIGGILPLDDVDSGDLDLAGRLTEMIQRLGAAVEAFRRTQTVPAWGEAIAAAAASLTGTVGGEEWQAGELRQLLDDLVDEATAGDRTATAALTLAEVRSLLTDRLRGRATRANFRTGHLTVCTLVPMRSVPHRVVCLLGLDDGQFPRHGPSDGDDLVARSPCVGDRDARSEDRQLLLDAVLAATDALVITYSGRDPRTNAALPPAVPLGELLDVVDATVRTDTGEAARERITVEHPLQPFDARNFSDAGLGRPGPWSFDRSNLRGARARRNPRAPAAPMLAGPLPARPRGVVELDDLIRFVQHPVRAFFRQRLGVSFTDRVDDIDDALPIDLDGLGRWNIGDRMLTGRLAGVPEAACQAAELARGDLPPGALGAAILGRVAPVVERLVHVAARYQPPAPTDGPASGDHGSASRSTDVAVDLGGGDVVVGTVTGLAGPVALVVTYSSVRARQRLAAWVRLLALSAAEPSVAWTAVTIGPRQQAVAVATVGPLPGDATGRGAAARAHLRVLVDLYRRGMDQPLPLYCETSAAWANAVRAGRNPVAAARAEWQTDPGRPDWRREDEDADHRWALDGVADFDDLTGDPVRPDEDGPGWADDQPTRLGRYALRLWGGLLTHERIEAV